MGVLKIIRIPHELRHQIQRYQAERQIETESEAIRLLLEEALKSYGPKPDPPHPS